MPRNYSSAQTISIHGKSIGIQHMSSAQTGSTRSRYTFTIPGDSIRVGVSTAETTGTQLHPFGVSMLTTGTSQVFVLNPPIPGVQKTIVTSGASATWVKTRNGETIECTHGSSNNTIQFTSYSFVQMIGLTTARWLVTGFPLTSASFDLTTST